MQYQLICLSSLAPGWPARVAKITVEGSLRRRLQDLGLIPGTSIRCCFSAPSGSPAAYEIRGALIALRQLDAEKILVCPQEKPGRDAS